MLGAMAAYNECCDFIYKEQDCLAFGDWANQLYKDAGMRPAALGRGLMPPHSQLKSSQSLFMVKHSHIPTFIMHYISMGEDHAAGPTTGENKFRRMIEMYPSMYAVQSGWNLDRDRTVPFQKLKEKGEPWAIQQVTPQEFEVIQSLNLI